MGPPPPDEDRGDGILAWAWIIGAIGCILLGMRMYVRSVIVKTIGWDDITMIIAVILAIVTNIVTTLAVHYGVGRHALYLTDDQRVNAVYMIWLAVPFSPGSAAFGKVSIALLLMRIMNRNRFREAFLWVLIFLLFAVNLVLIIITFAQCQPVTFLWQRVSSSPPPGGSCWDPSIQRNYGYFQGAFSAWSDLVLALFPIFIMWNVQIPLKVKAGIVVLMSLGILATVAAIVKTVELRNLATMDFTWDAVPLQYWFLAENWIIIICACVPTIKPLFTDDGWRLTNIFSRFSGKSTGHSTDKKSLNNSGSDFSDSQKRSYNMGSMANNSPYSQIESSHKRSGDTDTHLIDPNGQFAQSHASQMEDGRIYKTTDLSVQGARN
jgi:hypothetical protein